MMKLNIRSVIKEDLPFLKKVLNSIDLFPAEMLEDMINDYFNNSASEDIWLTATTPINGKDVPISLAYCAPEKLAEGTFNLYAIGVRSDIQGSGAGRKMMDYLEDLLRQDGQRILIVETSGADEFTLTRDFYASQGYSKEAVIRDFWAEGDDKVVFWKKLGN